MRINKIFKNLLLLMGSIYSVNTLSHEIITRVTVPINGQESSGGAFAPSISADGRYIAFHSNAVHLVPDDHNSFSDIFVYDRQKEEITRVNISSRGEEANFVSFFPKISASGRFVVFHSDASNLVEDDRNNATDIFLHDRETGITSLVSISFDGEQSNATSSEPTISADERYIVFHSDASNLVKNDTNRKKDIFRYDRETMEMQRVSVTSKGKQVNGGSFGAAISENGCIITFSSEASNPVKEDTNEATDVFVHDCETEGTMRVSINTAGEQGNDVSFGAAISANGRYIAFVSRATRLVADDTNGVEDVFLHDRETQETTRVSVDSDGREANGASFGVAISADGRYLTFNSDANNLVTDDDNANADVFIYDRETGMTQRLTLISQGPHYVANAAFPPAISQDNRWIAFESKAWNLVANDFNEASDIFVYDREYYATFEMATGILYIPVLTVPEIGLFRASLQLIATGPTLQFELTKSSVFRIPLLEVPGSYTLATGVLSLPNIEVIDPSQEIRHVQAELRQFSDAETLVFEVTKLTERP